MRRGTYKWGPKNQCKKNARIGRNQYTCAGCKGVFPNKEVNVDHIEPVVTEQGFTTFDDYIYRMFCPIENLQVLCSECHNAKTLTEVGGRKRYRRKKATK